MGNPALFDLAFPPTDDSNHQVITITNRKTIIPSVFTADKYHNEHVLIYVPSGCESCNYDIDDSSMMQDIASTTIKTHLKAHKSMRTVFVSRSPKHTTKQ